MQATGTWTKLLTEGQIADVVRAFEAAIESSFKSDAVLRPVRTRDEIKRRFDICARVFEELRVGRNWSIPRIRDVLPRLLRCELDGAAWPVEDGQSWSPDAT
jgi:hypothetical protein